MLNAPHNVITRNFLKLTAVLLLLVGGVAAYAANTGAPPQLVPYTVSLLAGNAQLASPVAGYAGDGQVGANAWLSSPDELAVDSVGNVYFPDTGNAVIREINAQTGVITTVAGTHPTRCGGSTGTTCAGINTGCADGVQAVGSPVGGSIHGIAIDAYGNIYFSDSIAQTISVVYRGGAQVAAFIKLEDPNGVTASKGAVQAGYVYHVAGTVNLTNCAGTASRTASTTQTAIAAGDGSLAFNSGATFGSVQALSLDSAGNLYIGDGSPNNVIRVINTQSVAQTFYGVTVQPGYIASIANCGSLTTLCPPGAGNSPVTTANTGVGGPAGGAVFNTLATGQGQWMNTDAYGNLYELNYKGATPGLYLGVAYAGAPPVGTNPLAGLINQANKLSNITNVPSLPAATAGDFYYLIQSLTLRPSSIAADAAGNLYYQDNHYGEVYRIDVNSVAFASDFLEYSTLFAASRNSVAATTAAPAFCYSVGSHDLPSTTNPTLTGYTTTDQYGDGCDAIDAAGPGSQSAGTGYGSTIADGPGDIFLADRSHNLIREVALNNRFPVTALGKSVQQTIQMHFDQGNLPIQVTLPPTVETSSFSMSPGTTDFAISPISTVWTNTTGSGLDIGGTVFTSTSLTGAVTPPVCANTTSSVDLSLDCNVNIIFTPTEPGLRQGQLVVTTANGSIYHYSLYGIGSGGQLAIDGGAATPVNATGLGNTGQVAVSVTGTVYIADPTNNRVVVSPPGGGTQTTIGTGLKNPMGVTVDAAGNVYIADTGNNRVVEVSQITGAQTVMGQVLAVGSPAYGNYTFKAPQGLAVDQFGNVYVADTGNGKVVEIPSNPQLGGATPLLQYPNAPTFTSPVAVAVDQTGNIYVADTAYFQIQVIPAGGGDLQNLPGTTIPGKGVFNKPSGVAVDGAGNLYVSDISNNTVTEFPSASGPGSEPVVLNFPGLKLTGTASGSFAGGSIAMDTSGNLYVSDSGNSRVLMENRQNPIVSFGTVPQDQASGSATPQVLTVTNIGNLPISITSPIAAIGSTSPAGNTAFAVSNTCSGSTLVAGLHCTITPTFTPTADGNQSATVNVNGGSQTISLTGFGEQPLVNVVLSVTSPAGGPVAGQPVVVTATVTQPNIAGDVPLGPIAFSYTNSCDATGSSQNVQLAPSGPGTSTASFTIPSVLIGRKYTVNAVYTDDALNSPTTASPLTFYIPGNPVTAVASSVSFVYGAAVPALSGTVTGILPADASTVSYKFVTAATSSTPIGVYPITVAFSGGNACNYGFPTVLTSGGAPATVTETAAPLAVKANNATTLYGAANLSYTSVVTGAVNGDQFAENYTPAASSILNVNTYPIVPTVVGNASGNYTTTVTNGTLTVTQAPTGISVSTVAPSVLASALSTDPVSILVGTQVTAGKGTPTGSVTITDTFTPITATAPGTSAPNAPVTIGPLSLVAGAVTYTPTSTALGTHVYTVSYSGDSNFQASTTVSPVSLVVDNADFTVTSTTNPILIAPGVIPGGNSAAAGEASATPETATVTITSILSFTGTVTLSCVPQNPTYVTCVMTPAAVTVPAPASGSTSASIVSTISISTPATLPLNFNFGAQLRKPVSETVLAFLPLGALAFCFRRRRRLSKALWMLLAIAALTTGLNGCGSNSVHYFTPVPAGPQTVTIFATGTSPTTSTQVTRSFTVTINIQ